MKFFVYTITHAESGRVYVGQTRNAASRWKSHLYSAAANHRALLYSAIRTYGAGAFVFEVVRECDTLNEAILAEKELIGRHNSRHPDHGYNGNAGQSRAESASYVYCVTNKRDGKRYVGLTQNISSRWCAHKYSARTGSLLPLHVAMRAYGADNFTIAILEQCHTRCAAEEAEARWIVEFNTIDRDRGYNRSVTKDVKSGYSAADRKRFNEIQALASAQTRDRRTTRISATIAIETILKASGCTAENASDELLSRAAIAAGERPSAPATWL